MTYARNIIVSLDQLANTIFGGTPDGTISARTGFNIIKRPHSRYWRIIRFIIDSAFSPVEENHCVEAYRYDANERYRDGGAIEKTCMAITVLAFFIVAAIPLRIAGAFGARI